MILPHLLEHAKKQHVAGVFIALVVVMPGVFIGPQVIATTGESP